MSTNVRLEGKTGNAPMNTALLIFPHQLFANHPALEEKPNRIVLIEEPLFFGDPAYPARFHKQKIWLHRATMKEYAKRFSDACDNVTYVDYREDSQLLDSVLENLAKQGVTGILLTDPHDFILQKRLDRAAEMHNLNVEIFDTPQFLNTSQLNCEYRDGRKSWFMADFYKWQRKRLNIMVDGDGKPDGGKWSFDEDNRKKVPKNKLADIPFIAPRHATEIEREAVRYVEENWQDNPGRLGKLWYPTDHESAANWLDTFLEQRFHHFGDYEDAIVKGESWLWHSALTPMLNTGLLTPREVVNRTLDFATKHNIPINALEGFIRQIIGWREFMRATYDDLGVKMRTTNHWKHTRRLPSCFYDATTGIAPLDDTISRINETAYCHHIERLMVLGGFMFLCEFDPDDIYRWFMEMFIDSYDWVMVTNAYAMSQNADGGLITTKPYFSGSNYVKKMSNWTGSDAEGDWAEVWDGLYWRWIDKHAEELEKNPRWSMMVAAARRMEPEKMKSHKDTAAAFLRRMTLDGERRPAD